MTRRRSGVAHMAIPLEASVDTERRHCAFCRREIRHVPQRVGTADHWRHVPRPPALSTYGRG